MSSPSGRPAEVVALAPEIIIYRQIERILQARFEGIQATESLFLLSASLKSIRTPEYDEKASNLARMVARGDSVDKVFYEWYEVLIDLLAKNGLWLVPHKMLGKAP